MTIEAMKQALEALLEINELSKGENAICLPAEIDGAMDALRTAIEQAEKQEPRCAVIVEVFGKDWRLDYMSLPVGKHKLYTQEYVYTTPPAAQPCQTCEALARTVMMDQTAHDTTPPAAQRQPLTDKQIGKILDDPNIAEAHQGNWLVLPYAFARAIEAAHGITGEKPDAA
jgi:hypothetical protein